MADKKWIQGAIKHPGALTARAKAAHETLAEYEAAPHRDPTIRREVALAERLQHMHHHPKQGRSK